MIELEEVDSTNSYLKSHPEFDHGTAVSAIAQRAGRGQRGNSWEAEPGKNLTLSVVVMPRKLAARDQFRLSMAVALAVRDTLCQLLPEPDRLTVKWPNDIYYDNFKIGGILIENSLGGEMIKRSVVGIGINVNQERFVNAGPNPVSVKQLTGKDIELRPLLEAFIEAITEASTAGVNDWRLKDLYMSRLWRREGIHGWRLPDGHSFQASISDITPEGYLCLTTAEGETTVHPLKTVFADIPLAAEPALN